MRQILPGDVRVHVDRPLPFLCLQRGPDATLVDGEAAYLLDPVHKDPGPRAVARELALLAQERYGGFLLMELVPTEVGAHDDPIRVYTDDNDLSVELAGVLARHLGRLRIAGRAQTVGVLPRVRGARGPRPLLGRKLAAELGCVQLTVAIDATWKNEGGELPGLLRRARKIVGAAMRHTAYRFAKDHTTYRTTSWHALGRRAVVKAVWTVDEQLSRVARSFDFLLCVSPVNGDGAWRAFQRSGFEKVPLLRYRPLPVDPGELKRTLYRIPIERVEDPTLSDLFLEKRAELDRQLTMLGDRGTPRFVYGSLAAYGACSSALVRRAEEVLETVSATARGRHSGASVDATEFARRAEEELAWYRERWKGFDASVEIRSDMSGGLMVSQGRLLVPGNTSTPAARVDALIQHEVGTHLLTWCNGRSQRLKQLQHGLAGYEELQEGIAVLAEYLAGGMSPARLRILAGRVIIADACAGGASFIDSYRLLRRYGFGKRAAFSLVVRIYRSGGFTKDLVYLRGLLTVLDHLSQGGELEPLFVGKIAATHLPIVRELQSRRVLTPPGVLPRYLERPEAQVRLERVRNGLQVHELLEA